MAKQEKRKHIVCFTGHRPEKLKIPESQVKSALLKEIIKSIDEGYRIFITGMARGVDMWAAEIVIKLKEKYPDIKLIAAVPFQGFELKWSEKNKKQYYDILNKADSVNYISKDFSYSTYQIRNKWMIDHSARVIAIWNGEKSGTKNTIDYAKKCGIEFINIYQTES